MVSKDGSIILKGITPLKTSTHSKKNDRNSTYHKVADPIHKILIFWFF